MNKQVLFAAVLSLLIHWFILKIGFHPIIDKPPVTLKNRNVVVTMSYKESEKPAEKLKKTVKNKPKPKVIATKKVKKKIEKTKLEQKIQDEPTPPSPKTEPLEKLEARDNPPESILNDSEPQAMVKKKNTSDAATIKEASPLYHKNPPPVYPRVARRRGHQGIVTMEVLVDEVGKVKDLRVLKSSGYRALDDAAVSSVMNWLFLPGMKGNKPVEMWVKLPVRFQLE